MRLVLVAVLVLALASCPTAPKPTTPLCPALTIPQLPDCRLLASR